MSAPESEPQAIETPISVDVKPEDNNEKKAEKQVNFIKILEEQGKIWF